MSYRTCSECGELENSSTGVCWACREAERDEDETDEDA